MTFRGWSGTNALGWIVGLSIAAFTLLIMGGPRPTPAQETKRAGEGVKSSGNATEIARGKYIVEGVAACGDCHTPRMPNGELDYSRWLAGAPVPYLSARPEPDGATLGRLAACHRRPDDQTADDWNLGHWQTASFPDAPFSNDAGGR